MVSVSPFNSFICPRCLHSLSRQRSSLVPRLQLRPQSAHVSQKALSNARTEENASRVKIKKHWNTDFRGPFKSTWASRSALHVGAPGENKKVSLTSTRPVGLVRGGRQRRRDGIVQEPSRPLEPPKLPGRNIKRPSRRPLSAGVTKDAGGWELVPSTPSWLSKSNVAPEPAPATAPPPPPPPPPIFAPETPSVHSRLSLSTKEDFNYYWETFPPTIGEKTRANHFFTKAGPNAKLLTSAPKFRLIPDSNVPEVAFVGRSNVGKSSLLNAVVNADIKALLARTSSTPGFTKTMNFYGLGPGNGVVLKQLPGGKSKVLGLGGLTIVDMPGYGQGSLTAWGVEIMKYIQSRRQLRRVFVLLDAELGVKDKDRSLLASLRLAGVSHQIILSKLDKVYIPHALKEVKRYDGKTLVRPRPKGSLEDVEKMMQKVRKDVQPPVGGGALGEILAFSAETIVDGKRLGIDHVRYAVLKAVGLDGGMGSFKGDAFNRMTSPKETGDAVKK